MDYISFAWFQPSSDALVPYLSDGLQLLTEMQSSSSSPKNEMLSRNNEQALGDIVNRLLRCGQLVAVS